MRSGSIARRTAGRWSCPHPVAPCQPGSGRDSVTVNEKRATFAAQRSSSSRERKPASLRSASHPRSRGLLQDLFPDAIRVADADGAVFGLNSASDARNGFISPRATGYDAQLRERGYNPVHVDLAELLLGGGGIKCCTLELRGGTR